MHFVLLYMIEYCCTTLSQSFNEFFFYLKQRICHGYRPRWPIVDNIDEECQLPLVARRYNKEERRERIERYKSKRRQRNFTKKIKVHIQYSTLHWSFFLYHCMVL